MNDDNILKINLNKIDEDMLFKFLLVMNEIIKYNNIHDNLEFILIEDARNRCPNGSRRKNINCVKTKKKCPNGSHKKKVNCIKIKSEKKERCPNGSHRNKVNCMKIYTQHRNKITLKKKTKNCNKFKVKKIK